MRSRLRSLCFLGGGAGASLVLYGSSLLTVSCVGDEASDGSAAGASSGGAADGGAAGSASGGSSGGLGGDEGSGGAGAAPPEDPAYLVFVRQRNPSGRTMYASIVPSLEAGDLELDDALELSGLSRAKTYGGKLFAFDGEAGVVTRYRLDEGRSLVLDTLEDGETPAQVSFAGLGVSIFSTAIAFVSPSRAFYFDTLSEDLVIEWDPTEMTITQSFSANLYREGYTTNTGELTVMDGYIALPVSWSNSGTLDFIPSHSLAVLKLDPADHVDVIDDDRCIGANGTFAYQGYVYSLADNLNGLATLSEGAVPPPCLLRWKPGAASFDNYYLDLEDLTGFRMVSGTASPGDGTFLTQAFTSEVDLSELGPFDVLYGPYWQPTTVDFVHGTTTVVTALPQSALAATGWAIDEELMTPLTKESRAELFQVDGEDATELLSVPGELFGLERMR